MKYTLLSFLLACLLAGCVQGWNDGNINITVIPEKGDLVWQLQPDSAVGVCTNDYTNNDSVRCWQLVYTPKYDGSVIGYECGFLAGCLNGNIIVQNKACHGADYSNFVDMCNTTGYTALNAVSGGFSIPVQAEESVMLHQICVQLPLNTATLIDKTAYPAITINLQFSNGNVYQDSTNYFGYFVANWD